MSKGQRIKNRREQLNIGQTELAEKIQVSKQTLYKYENDIVTNIPSDKIEAIAKVLDTTPGYIMGWEDADIEIADTGFQDALKLYYEFQSLPPDKQAEFLNFLKFLQLKP